MGKARALVNKLKRRRKNSNKNRGFRRQDKIDRKDEVLADSPGAYKYLRGVQRRYNASFGQEQIANPKKAPQELLTQANMENVAVNQIEQWDFNGLTGADFDVNGAAKYISIALPEGFGQGYIWFTVVGGANTQTDPAPAGETLVGEVSINSPSDTASQIVQEIISGTGVTIDWVALNGATGGFTPIAGPTEPSVGILEIAADLNVPADAGDAGTSGTSFSVVQSGGDQTQATFASAALVEAIGLQAGDIVRMLDGALKGKELTVTAVAADVVTLETAADLTAPEAGAQLKVQISGTKTSYE